MSAEIPVFRHFCPGKAKEQIPYFLPHCKTVREQDGGRTLEVELDQSLLLDERELGRLLLIYGKCANEGIRIRLRCSEQVAEQLSRLLIDRLIDLERISA